MICPGGSRAQDGRRLRHITNAGNGRNAGLGSKGAMVLSFSRGGGEGLAKSPGAVKMLKMLKGSSDCLEGSPDSRTRRGGELFSPGFDLGKEGSEPVSRGC